MGWRRAIAWLGAGSYFLAVLALLERERPASREMFDKGSTFRGGDLGLSLAYRYLSDRATKSPGRAKVAALLRPVDPEELEGDGVVFRMRPSIPSFLTAGALLTPKEEEWIRRGGRLVLGVAAPYGPVGVDAVGDDGEVRQVFPLGAGPMRLLPAPRRVLSGWMLDKVHAVLVLGNRPLLGRWPVGKGEVFLMACPEVFENRLLGEGDHLELLDALAGSGRSVYFDEYVHGGRQDVGMGELMLRWGLGPFLAVLGLTGAAAFWRGRKRLGLAEEHHEEKRSEAVDLVASLGQLYDRALRRDEALGLYHENLSREASLRTGLRGDALRVHVKRLVDAPPATRRPKRDLGIPEFDSALRRINDGFRRLRHADSG